VQLSLRVLHAEGTISWRNVVEYMMGSKLVIRFTVITGLQVPEPFNVIE